MRVVSQGLALILVYGSAARSCRRARAMERRVASAGASRLATTLALRTTRTNFLPPIALLRQQHLARSWGLFANHLLGLVTVLTTLFRCPSMYSVLASVKGCHAVVTHTGCAWVQVLHKLSGGVVDAVCGARVVPHSAGSGVGSTVGVVSDAVGRTTSTDLAPR